MLNEQETLAMWTERAKGRLQQAAQEAQDAGLSRGEIMSSVYSAITRSEDDE